MVYPIKLFKLTMDFVHTVLSGIKARPKIIYARTAVIAFAHARTHFDLAISCMTALVASAEAFSAVNSIVFFDKGVSFTSYL